MHASRALIPRSRTAARLTQHSQHEDELQDKTDLGRDPDEDDLLQV